jgi:glycogen debranching enzyme
VTWQGLYHHDSRMLSRLELRLDGRMPPLLSSRRVGASAAHQVFVVDSDEDGTPTALLVRERELGDVMCDRYQVRVLTGSLDGVELTLEWEADFAELKKGARRPAPVAPGDHGGDWRAQGPAGSAVAVTASAGLVVEGGRVHGRVHAAPDAPWTADVTFRPCRAQDVPFDGGAPDHSAPPRTLELETAATPWSASVTSALDDLHALRVEVPSLGLTYLGAGAPWFMALFGRDSLITAWEALLAGHRFGVEALDALAHFQGRQHDARTGEQPGRVLHELRTGDHGVFGLEPGRPYYGAVDATPMFVVLLGELHRWGAPDADIVRLLPAARAAVRWCIDHGDIDGDGFVEYVSDPQGIGNQGWKDSGDSMVHADGSLAPTPLALAEVQALVWAAYRELAALEERFGDPPEAASLRRRADALQAAFIRAFWLPDHGIVAMGLDADKQPLAVASSNMGHCLWTGILPQEVADTVAVRLAQPDLLTSWGVRTLASSERAYNPLGYHLGTVWPHDSALVAAGLMASGHPWIANKVLDGLLRAADSFGWRLPELYGGLDVDEIPAVLPYPVACSPQAWSAAAPLLLLRTVLRLDPDVPRGRIHLAPVLPSDVELVVRGIPVADGTLAIRARGTEVEVLEVPAGLEVVTRRRVSG